MNYQVTVIGLSGQRMTIDLCNTEEQMRTMTVQQLKTKIVADWPGGAAGALQDNLVLIFTDKQLEDAATLVSYGVQHLSIIQVVLRVPGGGDINHHRVAVGAPKHSSP
ncbi:hypothetical protein CRUP_015104 [Coryphaenoides rupestris]|nr:hypothetical protein CRUP_015104 [Coryphaenoides rupestris]